MGSTAAAGPADRLGFKPGMVIQELGWDSDTDDALRVAIEDAIDGDLVDADYGNDVDAVLRLRVEVHDLGAALPQRREDVRLDVRLHDRPELPRGRADVEDRRARAHAGRRQRVPDPARLFDEHV